MSNYYVGGYIFFSAVSSRSSLMKLILSRIELPWQDELDIWLPDDEGNHNLSILPKEQALHELEQVEDGGFDVKKGTGRLESYWFDQPAGPYQTVQVSCIDNLLNERINQSGGDQIAKRWLSLCQEGKATFGFFGQFEQMIEIEYRDTQLPALEQKDVQKLMAEWPAYWLIYLDSELAALWQGVQQPFQAYEKRWLSSGAFFARAHPGLHS